MNSVLIVVEDAIGLLHAADVDSDPPIDAVDRFYTLCGSFGQTVRTTGLGIKAVTCLGCHAEILTKEAT